MLSAPFIQMLNGLGITVSQSANGVVVNGDVPVLQTDLSASNGIIHVIGGVLLPPEPNGTLAVGQECWAELSGAGTTRIERQPQCSSVLPRLNVGAACGPGLGDCGESSDCLGGLCLPKQSEGSSCGEESVCASLEPDVFADDTETSSICVAETGFGGALRCSGSRTL